MPLAKISKCAGNTKVQITAICEIVIQYDDAAGLKGGAQKIQGNSRRLAEIEIDEGNGDFVKFRSLLRCAFL